MLLLENINNARKMFRLLESLREYGLLLKILQTQKGSSKYLLAFGRVTTMLYWLSENLYGFTRLNLFPKYAKFGLIFYCVMGLICYFEVIIYEFYNIFKSKGNCKVSLITIIKETIDNIELLPYLGLIKPSWTIKFLSSIGCTLNGILTLYINIKFNGSSFH